MTYSQTMKVNNPEKVYESTRQKVVDEATPKQKKAWGLYSHLQQVVKTHTRSYLEVGNTLKTIRDGKLYLYVGEWEVKTFQDFLNSPEIGIRRATAYLYIQIWETYIDRLKMTPEEVSAVPLNRLMRLCPQLKNLTDDEARELVEQATDITNPDFDRELRQRKLDPTRPVVKKCKECGGWEIEIEPESLCQCKDKTPIHGKYIAKEVGE